MSLLENPVAVDGQREGARPDRARRSRSARFSRPHWVALVAGVLAALTVMAALRDRREVTLVAVADNPIVAGSPVTADDVRWAEVPAESAVVDGLVDQTAIAEPGLITVRPLAEGEPIADEALTTSEAGFGVRAISVPVAPEHAVGGDLRPGDRVDVVDVASGRAVYAVTDAEVLAVDAQAGGSVGDRPSQLSITIAVDADGALRVSAAMEDERVEVVRSTGAPPAGGPAPPSPDNPTGTNPEGGAIGEVPGG